jgi:nucleotide-binding universal stress UspA family protein
VDIVDFAHEIGADYLVIGVRKRLKVEKIIFGSNVQHVVLHSPCPVVTINE